MPAEYYREILDKLDIAASKQLKTKEKDDDKMEDTCLGGGTYVKDADGSTAIVRLHEENKTYKIPYSEDGAGYKFAEKSKWTEVEDKTVYVPVGKDGDSKDDSSEEKKMAQEMFDEA